MNRNDALDRPARSPERAALELAVKRLVAMRDSIPVQRFRSEARDTLVAIDAIVPGVVPQ